MGSNFFRVLFRGAAFAVLVVVVTAALLAFSTMVVFAGTQSSEQEFSPSQETVLEAMDDYTAFVPYDGGIILPAQITPDLCDSFVFVDTRTSEEFAEATITGASHIEWRDVFARLDEIPTDKKVVLFCNTGALSAQSAFGLRVMGYENVLILQTGFEGWKTHHAIAVN
jgi:rhodanese-related sulfurtransferase